MKTKKARILELNAQMRSLQESAAKDKRSLSEEEMVSFNEMLQERNQLYVEDQLESCRRIEARMNVAGIARADNVEARQKFVDDLVKVAYAEDNTVTVSRAAAYNDSTTVGDIAPLHIGDVIGPLEKGLILDKVGCHIQSGLDGDWDFPVVDAIEATIEDEDAEVSDSKIDIKGVKPTPRRTVIAVRVSRAAFNRSNGKLYEIIQTQLNTALTRVLNKWMFQKTAIKTGAEGPFVKPGVSATYSKAVTFKDIINLKAAVDAKGVVPNETAAYVMSNTMAAALATTQRGNGDRMILEDGKINGVPVFITEYMAATDIYFGYFSYELIGQFGDLVFTVDPYSLSSKGQIKIVLETLFDMKAARKEAFGILSVGA